MRSYYDECFVLCRAVLHLAEPFRVLHRRGYGVEILCFKGGDEVCKLRETLLTHVENHINDRHLDWLGQLCKVAYLTASSSNRAVHIVFVELLYLRRCKRYDTV